MSDGEVQFQQAVAEAGSFWGCALCLYQPGKARILVVRSGSPCDNERERRTLFDAMHKALRFLVEQRPVLYREHFTTLPADSWLMMAINDLWDEPEFRQAAYRDFVFQDADQMVRQMYTPQNAVCPDYVGSFFYRHGDHPYPDGARGEGLVAAFHLAIKISDAERVARYHQALARLCWALLHLCNTPQSTYAAKRPDLAIGGIRFKFTRQWFRIDTIQHVAGVFLKFLRILTTQPA